MRKSALLLFLGILFASAPALADVEVSGVALRDYAMPGAFPLTESIIQAGADQSTLIATTTGEASNVRCSVVVATTKDASVYRYVVDEQPTQCVGMIAHPTGGFFLRTKNPQALPGEVTGVTVFVDGDGIERWKIRDVELVAASARPSGTGVFLGDYLTAFDTMVYSAESDKLLAFTIGKLTIGLDDKFIAQAHVINVTSGDLIRSGLTIGQSGGGIPVEATVRPDGTFIVVLDSLGLQGLQFFNYDGREGVEELKPLDDPWENKALVSMFYAAGVLNLVWLDPNDASVSTEIATTNDTGRELTSVTFDSTYQFADGGFVVLGPPTKSWRALDYLVISFVTESNVFLRFVDANGDSPGMARLDAIGAYPPAAIVGDENGLRLLSYDSVGNRMYEYALTFTETPDYNPDMGLADAGIPEIGIDDVLEEAGCGCGVLHQAPTPMGLVVLGFLAIIWRRR